MFGVDKSQGPWRFMSRGERAAIWCMVVVLYPITWWERRRGK